jgi:DNA-binding transcriptional LysR family regulator
MDRFKEITTFMEVARCGSLSGAARDEGVTPAMVGRRIDQLEARLNVKLFRRSTRAVTLTDEGAHFLEDAQRIVQELERAEERMAQGNASVSGRLGVSAPTAFGRQHVAPHLPRLMDLHPQLAVTLHLSERLVDMRNERIDVAIRIADLRNADLVAVKLAENRRVVCASPTYLKRMGTPSRLEDLKDHDCLLTATEDGIADTWHFQEGHSPRSIKVSGRMHCNDGAMLTDWARAGIGLAWRSTWEVAEDVKNGRLVTVLDGFSSRGNNIFAVFPERRHLPAKVRAFIEHLKMSYGSPPYWER